MFHRYMRISDRWMPPRTPSAGRRRAYRARSVLRAAPQTADHFASLHADQGRKCGRRWICTGKALPLPTARAIGTVVRHRLDELGYLYLKHNSFRKPSTRYWKRIAYAN